jgi:hypothetical protein
MYYDKLPVVNTTTAPESNFKMMPNSNAYHTVSDSVAIGEEIPITYINID